MGSKVNPNGLRFGINKNWRSRWIPKDNIQMGQWLVEDDKIRSLLIAKYKNANIDRIEIERIQTTITLFIYAGQPGILTGNENSNIKNIQSQVNRIVGRKTKVIINIIAVENSALSARLVAREIADAIENRVSFRTAQKFALRKVLKAGAKGVKTHVSGRLGGVEMARAEGYSQGIITLSTLRSNIDYALEEAHTTYGIIGVKVWINKGEIFNNKNANSQQKKNFANNQNNNRKEFNRNNSNQQNQNRKPVSQKTTNQKVGE